MAHSWHFPEFHLPKFHLPESYRHADAEYWYWIAGVIGMALILGYLLAAYGVPMNGVADWGPSP